MILDDTGLPIIGHIPYVPFLSNKRDKEESILKYFIGNQNNKNQNKETLFYKFRLQESVRSISSTLNFLVLIDP